VTCSDREKRTPSNKSGGYFYDEDRSDRTGCCEKITISGFGTFEMRERAERQGINPRTREPITIAASRSIVFKPGKSLKDTL